MRESDRCPAPGGAVISGLQPARLVDRERVHELLRAGFPVREPAAKSGGDIRDLRSRPAAASTTSHSAERQGFPARPQTRERWRQEQEDRWPPSSPSPFPSGSPYLTGLQRLNGASPPDAGTAR